MSRGKAALRRLLKADRGGILRANVFAPREHRRPMLLDDERQ
jgi:hypothetical protein